MASFERRSIVRKYSLVFWLLVFVAQAAYADLSVRECIKSASGGRWELVGDSQWHTMLTLGFNNVSISDIVAQAAIVYTEGPAQTGAKVDYQSYLDGLPSFVMQHPPHTGY